MTMEFLYRSATPAYKGSHAQPARAAGFFSRLGVVGGSATPAYQTVAGANAKASAPARSWWRPFAVTPSYRTATPCVDHVAPGEPAPDGSDGDAETEAECAERAMQVVIL
jgi:hypothetical protein